ncbi:hypothetical protein ACWC9T_28945 [Kitasatospora sp. NPDC001159]
MFLPDPDTAEQAALDALLHALTPRAEAAARGDLAGVIDAYLNVWATHVTSDQRARLAEIYTVAVSATPEWSRGGLGGEAFIRRSRRRW